MTWLGRIMAYLVCDILAIRVILRKYRKTVFLISKLSLLSDLSFHILLAVCFITHIYVSDNQVIRPNRVISTDCYYIGFYIYPCPWKMCYIEQVHWNLVNASFVIFVYLTNFNSLKTNLLRSFSSLTHDEIISFTKKCITASFSNLL